MALERHSTFSDANDSLMTDACWWRWRNSHEEAESRLTKSSQRKYVGDALLGYKSYKRVPWWLLLWVVLQGKTDLTTRYIAGHWLDISIRPRSLGITNKDCRCIWSVFYQVKFEFQTAATERQKGKEIKVLLKKCARCRDAWVSPWSWQNRSRRWKVASLAITPSNW